MGTQAVHRAMNVLHGIARGRTAGIGLTDIARQTGLNKSTAHRLIQALMIEGLVDQDRGSRKYSLGAGCHALGLAAANRWGVYRLAPPHVLRLAHETGDAAFFSLRQDAHALCMLREEGDFPLKSHVLAAGDQHPLGVGGGSQAMLAALPDDEVARCLDQNLDEIQRLYPRYTPRRLRQLVALGRKKGYSVNPGLVLEGSWGIGIALRRPDGQVFGALSIATVESRMTAEREALIASLLTREARALEKLAGERPAFQTDGPGPVNATSAGRK
jgi:DNA-binding IclR family transcriptional regulator